MKERMIMTVKKLIEEQEQLISKLCFDWWNFDKLPPEHLRTEEIISAMIEYIHSHPQNFRGLYPQ